GQCRDEHPLLPHLLDDSRAQARLESGPGQLLEDGGGAVRALRLALAETEAMQIIEMQDLACRIERRGDETLTAEHRWCPEVAFQHVQMAHPVQRGQYRGTRLDRRS